VRLFARVDGAVGPHDRMTVLTLVFDLGSFLTVGVAQSAIGAGWGIRRAGAPTVGSNGVMTDAKPPLGAMWGQRSVGTPAVGICGKDLASSAVGSVWGQRLAVAPVGGSDGTGVLASTPLVGCMGRE